MNTYKCLHLQIPYRFDLQYLEPLLADFRKVKIMGRDGGSLRHPYLLSRVCARRCLKAFGRRGWA